MKLQIQKLRQNAVLPTYGSPGAAGMDLYACTDEPITVNPGERVKIPTGIAIALPNENYVAVVCPRSGLAHKFGLSLSNCIGVIDSDYRGEIFVSVIHQGNEPYTVAPGERFCQMMILPVLQAELVLCDSLEQTERGAGGFGSTGTK